MDRRRRIDPFDLVRRMTSESPARLVEEFRALHRDGPVRGDAGTRSEAGPSDLVSLLRELAPPRVVTARANGGPSPADASAESAYDRARRHFQQHEERLREQALLSDQILKQLRPESAPSLPPAPAQQELRLSAAPRGRAGGRFVVENSLDRAAALELRPGVTRGITFDWEERVRVDCTPERARLAPGEIRTVSVGIPLDRCPGHAGDRLETTVEVLSDTEVVQVVWVVIDLQPEPIA